MTIDLTGKVIVLTGGSGGIGLAIAEQLLSSGAFVILQYNSQLPKSMESERLVFLKCDLSDSENIESFWNNVIQLRGRVDILINNAGVAISSSLEKDTEDWMQEWYKTLQINLTAAAILCRLAVLQFKKTGGGIIINITSRAALRGDTEDYLAYAASKGGLMSLTRSIARAFGRDEILAYDVAPGFTKTKMADQFIAEYGEDYAKKDIALNELTQPQDIADIVVFLASGRAKHATGTTIHINAASYVH